MAEKVLIVRLEVPYHEELEYLLDHPDDRSPEVSLEIGLSGWPCKIIQDAESGAFIRRGGRV
jgi:hypothetical protein